MKLDFWCVPRIYDFHFHSFCPKVKLSQYPFYPSDTNLDFWQVIRIYDPVFLFLFSLVIHPLACLNLFSILSLQYHPSFSIFSFSPSQTFFLFCGSLPKQFPEKDSKSELPTGKLCFKYDSDTSYGCFLIFRSTWKSPYKKFLTWVPQTEWVWKFDSAIKEWLQRAQAINWGIRSFVNSFQVTTWS
jgi:hypothetical protein